MKIKISDLKASAYSEKIYSTDASQDLIESIGRNGLIVPIWITSDNLIISGHRRVNAFKELGYDEIEAEVKEYSDSLVIESNRYREKTWKEKLAESDALEAILKHEAKRRQGKRINIHQNSDECFADKEANLRKEIKEDKSLPDSVKALKSADWNYIRKEVGRRLRKESMEQQRCVYVAKAGNRIKVGHSTDPENRMETLKSGNPEVQLLAYYPGSIKLEKRLHKILSYASLGHEWFTYSEKLLLDILECITKHDRHGKETIVRVAKKIGTSHDTLHKVKVIAKEDPKLLIAVDGGGESVNSAYKKIMREKNKEATLNKMTEMELPKEQYQIVLADPPWRYEYSVSNSREIENQYPTMTLKEICDMPIPEITTNDSLLFLWTTSPKLQESLAVIDSWEYIYRTCMVWVKDRIGMGYYARQQHELLLIAKRGKFPSPLAGTQHSSIIESPREEHSKKPEIVYEIIERMYPNFKFLELFCRGTARKNWQTWGNETKDS